MKTPSPQKAAKWAREKAISIGAGLAHYLPDMDALRKKDAEIENALLEADKNGYERGRKDSGMYLCAHHDSPACKECIDRLREFEENAFLKKDEALLSECSDYIGAWANFSNGEPVAKVLLAKLKQRLAPSVSVSDAKEPK